MRPWLQIGVVALTSFCGVASVRAQATAPTDAARKSAEESAAELDAIVDEAVAAESEVQKFSVYGFMDVGLQRISSLTPSLGVALPSEETSFVSGNNNIYLEVRPDAHWRGLIETRLSLLPHGDYKFQGLGISERTDTRIIDSTSPSGRNNVELGGIVVERAFMEWMHNDYLNVRVGRFFTPWGIWNVDHGTPTLIALMMPTFLVQDAIPQRQTGLQLFGRHNAPPWQVTYDLTLSNGRTATLFDTTDGKAIGSRVVIRRQGDLGFAAGMSMYHGDFQDEIKTLSVNASLDIELTKTTTVSYDENSIGVDVSVDYRGWRLRAEAMARQVEYANGKREVVTFRPTQPQVPDRIEYYGYVILAYRVLSYLEPYLYLEQLETNKRADVIEAGYSLSGGLNIYFTPAVQLKMQYARSSFENFLPDRNTTNFWTSRLVMAF
jgi:hypothetical protein